MQGGDVRLLRGRALSTHAQGTFLPKNLILYRKIVLETNCFHITVSVYNGSNTTYCNVHSYTV
jgi:hypothetical protein